MLTLICLITALGSNVLATPQTYGLPAPGAAQPSFYRQTFVLQDSPTQTPSFKTNIFTQKYQTPQPITSNFQTNPAFQRSQIINPNFQTSSQTNPAFQRNQIINPNFQTSNVLNDFSQSQVSSSIPQSSQFNRPPVRSGIENHPFLHGDTLELLPPLQHVVGTKYPRVEAGRGFRFPTAQLLNTTPPPNLLQ